MNGFAARVLDLVADIAESLAVIYRAYATEFARAEERAQASKDCK